MAINDNIKLDLLWKKVGFGVTETSATGKSANEENISSPYSILASMVWQQSALIPYNAAEVNQVVKKIEKELIPDPTIPSNQTWIAVENISNGVQDDNRLNDFIPFTVGPSYEVKIYKDDQLTERLLPGTPNQEWIFDYSAGVLFFPNGLPSGITKLYISGYRYIGAKGVGSGSGGGSDYLGTPTAQTYEFGYFNYWSPDITLLSDALYDVNMALKDLKPSEPISITEFTLNVTNSNLYNSEGIPVLLSSGVIDNCGNIDFKTVPGNPVSYVRNNFITSNDFGPFGPGNYGTLSAICNGNIIGSKNLTIGSDVGSYEKLEILTDIPYPETNTGFWEVIHARIANVEIFPGLNYIQLSHSNVGSSNPAFIVYDDITTPPTISSFDIIEDSNPNIIYSSGIPHYGENTRLLSNITGTNLATNLYFSLRNVEISSTPITIGSNSWVIPGTYGLPTILEKNSSYNIMSLPFVINNATAEPAFGTVQLKATARNINGNTNLINNTKINVLRGHSTVNISPIEENNIPILNLGDTIDGAPFVAGRIGTEDGLMPNTDFSGLTDISWDSSFETQPHEASIVGGSIIFDQTNYSQGYLPIGPNYSNKSIHQFATFMIRRRAVSLMNIEIVGKYSGLYIKLPGINNLPLTTNGWWNAKNLYNGIGTPGRDGPNGCALYQPASGFTQNVVVTFGHESSSNSQNNLIIIRFHLTNGDKITGLRFSGVE